MRRQPSIKSLSSKAGENRIIRSVSLPKVTPGRKPGTPSGHGEAHGFIS